MQQTKSPICPHSKRPCKKVCYHVKCKCWTFVCGCETCSNLHVHDGIQAYCTLEHLDTMMKTATSDRSIRKLKYNEVENTDCILTAQIANIHRQFTNDAQPLLKHLTLKSNIAGTIQRVREHSPLVIGTEMNYLFNSISNKVTHNEDKSAQYRLNLLTDHYNTLLQQLNTLNKTFIKNKTDILNMNTPLTNLPLPKQLIIDKTPDKINVHTVPLHSQQKRKSSSVSSGSGQSTDQTSENTTPNSTPLKISLDISKIFQIKKSVNQQEKFTKIKDIKPNAVGFNIVAKVIRIKSEMSENMQFIRCQLGDQTGTIMGRFYLYDNKDLLLEDAVVELRNLKAKVIKNHIVLNTQRAKCISSSQKEIPEINTKLNISDLQCEQPELM